MIAYTTVGTNNMERAGAFYDALFAELGGSRAWATDEFIAWSCEPRDRLFAVAVPYDGQPATVGNGVMIALVARTTDDVDRVYAKAIELGATSEGPAGPRSSSGFYAGYFRDLEGNKLAICRRVWVWYGKSKSLT